MQHLLDLLYSNTTVATVFTCVWMLVFTILSLGKYSKNRFFSWFVKVLCALIGVSPFFVLMFTYSGFANSFDSVQCGKTTMALLEKYETGEDIESVCRLHVVDKKTGTKLYRKYLGHDAYFRETRGDTLLLETDRSYQLIYSPDYTHIKTITKESLVQKFEELREGIEKTENDEYKGTFCIAVYCLNGKKYRHFPFTETLTPFAEEELKPANNSANEQLVVSKDQISIRKGNDSRTILQLNTDHDSKINKLLRGGVVRTGKDFLLGEFADYDSSTANVIIKYYSNTLQENFSLVQLDNKLNERWKYEQKNENLRDFYSRKATQDVLLSEDGFLYFNWGGFFVCLNKSTGQTIWKTRL